MNKKRLISRKWGVIGTGHIIDRDQNDKQNNNFFLISPGLFILPSLYTIAFSFFSQVHYCFVLIYLLPIVVTCSVAKHGISRLPSRSHPFTYRGDLLRCLVRRNLRQISRGFHPFPLRSFHAVTRQGPYRLLSSFLTIFVDYCLVALHSWPVTIDVLPIWY